MKFGGGRKEPDDLDRRGIELSEPAEESETYPLAARVRVLFLLCPQGPNKVFAAGENRQHLINKSVIPREKIVSCDGTEPRTFEKSYLLV